MTELRIGPSQKSHGDVTTASGMEIRTWPCLKEPRMEGLNWRLEVRMCGCSGGIPREIEMQSRNECVSLESSKW